MNKVDRVAFSAATRVIVSRKQAAKRGQTLVEYALILAIISIVAVGVMINLGKQVTTVYSAITSNVASAQASH